MSKYSVYQFISQFYTIYLKFPNDFVAYTKVGMWTLYSIGIKKLLVIKQLFKKFEKKCLHTKEF